MKTYHFKYIIGILFLYLGFVSCEKESSAPTVKGYLNGTEVSEIVVTLGTTVNFKYEIQSTSNLTKVEVFVRKGIGLDTDSQLFLRQEAATGDLDGNSLIVEGSLIASTDLMISIGAINSEGKITILQLNAILDVSKFNNLVMMDAKPDGTSKSFCDSQYGLNLFFANTKADPAAIDFGFAYLEADATAKACLISFSEYSKVGTYTLQGATNGTSFKKAASYTYTKAADLKTAFDNGTNFVAPTGYTTGLVASNLQNNDVIAFKTQTSKYGLILVTAIDRKAEAANSEQTIKFNLVVQK